MVSLQTDPLSEDLKQQLTAVSRDVEAKEGDEMEVTPLATLTEELEFRGQVEYFVDYCLDKYPMTYKTQVVYPRNKLVHSPPTRNRFARTLTDIILPCPSVVTPYGTLPNASEMHCISANLIYSPGPSGHMYCFTHTPIHCLEPVG